MRRQELQDATGVILRKPPVGVLKQIATTTPTNGQAGFATGCVWVNTSGTAGSIYYINTGTNTSSTWTNLA